MKVWPVRVSARGWVALWVCVVVVAFWGDQEVTAQSNWTVPSVAPILENPDFECGLGGYTSGVNATGETVMVPNGWRVIYLDGSPMIASTRLRYRNGVCDDSGGLPWVEKFNGSDSLIVLSQDIESLPAPGKPFDVVLYQQVPVTVGGVYSLSGWLLSICGNNHQPFDCPEGYYIAKAVGLDPMGGTDPDAASVVWVENRANFVDSNGERVGWQNMYTSVRALTPQVTVFVRVTSPFQWHGNLAFVDAFSLVRGPLSALTPLPEQVEGNQVEVGWTGQQSLDVLQMEGSTHELLFDVQVRHGRNGEWRDLVNGAVEPGTTTFSAQCMNTSYAFRVRARAEQPEGSGGMWPNHRYPGVWSDPVSVYFAAPQPVDTADTPTEDGTVRLFVPALAKTSDC